MRKYLFMTLGLLINAASGVLCIKASIGTSPLATLPYTMNQIVPAISLGTFNFFLSLLFFIMSAILLGREFRLYQALQIPVSLMFSVFMDFWMIVFRNLVAESYMESLLLVLAGCVISGLGFSIMVTSGVALDPNTIFVNALAKQLRRPYGRLKVCNDVAVVLISALLSLLFLHRIAGIREGTVISSLLIGRIAGLFNRKLCLIRQNVNSTRRKTDAGNML